MQIDMFTNMITR